jgi:hypothetical protein
MLRECIHYASIAAGITLVYVALFLYESEEDRLQRGLEASWIHIDDFRETALRVQKSFVASLTARTGQWLDLGLGSLFSLTALCVSVCFPLTSLVLFQIIISVLFPSADLKADWFWAAALAMLGLAPLILRRHLLRRAWLFGCIGVCLAFLLFRGSWVGPYDDVDVSSSALAVAYHIGAAIGAVSALAFLISVRALLRWGARRGSLLSSLALFFTSCGFFCLAILLPRQLYDHCGPPIKTIALATCGCNFCFLMLTFVVDVLALILILHQLLWVIMSRLLYAASHYGIVHQKKLLGASGVALIGFGCPPLAKLLKTLFGLLHN